MRRRLVLLCSVVAITCVLGVVPPADAAPVIYNEYLSGDVDGQFFTFDIGTHSISGFYVGSDNFSGGPSVEPDQFDFSIPGRTVLVGVTLSTPTPMGAHFTLWGLDVGGLAGITTDPSFDWPCTPASCSTHEPLSWGPGSYHVRNGDCGPTSLPAVGPFACDYQLDFTVAARVPEPSATFLLLATGLAGLGGLAWRRHRCG